MLCNVYYVYYILTPCNRVLLEKITDFQLVKKFPTFYVTRRFITALTSVRHLSLSWASSIQSIPPHPSSSRSILIYAWVSQVFSFPQVSPPKPFIRLSSLPYVLLAAPISFFSIWSPQSYWLCLLYTPISLKFPNKPDSPQLTNQTARN